jgi:hypothetical protein
MMTTLLLLSLLLAATRAQDDVVVPLPPGPSCGDCAAGDCKVLETVKVNRLCADELCVGGSSVVVGDGNPCTSDDVVDGKAVHLPIENCCATDADCARWAPAPSCITAECVHTEELTTHGWCRFSAVPECCAEAKDCPAKACQTATCTPTEAGALHFSAERKRFVQLDAGQLDNIPGRCVYARDEDCCLTTRDCVGQCPPGTFGICDKAMTCQCVPSNDNECAADSDCAADEAAKRVCEEGCDDETKPPCYYYECDRGWCTCVFDPDRDYDGDGVCCKNDCNDRDPDAQEQTLCPVGDATDIDADGDGFYLCGTVVEPSCEPTCPNGLAPVPRESVVDMNGQLVLKFDCDCCDDNAAGLDQPLTCAKDANDNDLLAPPAECLPNDFACQQCYEELCVLQPESGKVPSTDTAVLDALCAAAKGDDYAYYEVPMPAPPAGQCDFCDDVEDATSRTPTWMCPLEYDVGTGDDAVTRSICPKAITDPDAPDNQEYTPALLADCCEYILTTNANDPNAHPQIQQLQACCAGLELIDYVAPCGACASTMGTLFPGTCDRCECNNEWETPCNADAFPDSDFLVQCVEDADGDGYYNCDAPRNICYSQRLQGPAVGNDERCRNALGASFVSLDTATQQVVIDTDGYSGTYCDCDDTLREAHQLIACGTDADADGFLACKEPTCTDGGFVAQAPVCTQVCALTCEAPATEITAQNCGPVAPPVRRRSALEQVKEVAARHGWFDEKKAAATGDKRKRQVDLPAETRTDTVCDDLKCNNCDCCDSSSFVHPGSTFGTAALNECGNYDMNCDCMYHSTVACPNSVSDATIEHYYKLADTLAPAPSDAVDFSVGIRNLGNATAAKYVAGAPFKATPDRLGYCGDDCANMCADFVPGISLESPFGGPVNRKRAISINLQKSCTALISLDASNLDVNHNVLTLTPGQCFEFIEACGTPCNSDGNCNADCEICTKLWS